MDQKVIAGIGNIYRTEILWLRRIHPMTRGVDLTEEALRELWDEMRTLLQLGVETNRIITKGKPGKAQRRLRARTNIFGKRACPACKGPVTKETLSGRTLYHCPACQVAGESV